MRRCRCLGRDYLGSSVVPRYCGKHIDACSTLERGRYRCARPRCHSIISTLINPIHKAHAYNRKPSPSGKGGLVSGSTSKFTLLLPPPLTLPQLPPQHLPQMRPLQRPILLLKVQERFKQRLLPRSSRSIPRSPTTSHNIRNTPH